MPKFSVAESITIKASPQQVYDTVADFGTWTTWSPWLCQEPDAKVVVSDSANSVGSGYQWHGEIVGQGEMEHKDLQPGTRIVQDLRFLKPWKSQAGVTWNFAAADGGTHATWTMQGSLPWFMFWMKNMMSGLIGMDYARGLRMLKEYVESGSVLSATTVKGVETVGPFRMIGVRRSASMDDLGPVMESAIAEACEKLSVANVQHNGEVMAAYHDLDFKTRVFDFSTGFVVSDSTPDVPGLSTWSCPQVQAMTLDHIGRYENLGNAWSSGYQQIRFRKLKQNRRMATFERYANSPENTQPDDLLTHLYLPLK